MTAAPTLARRIQRFFVRPAEAREVTARRRLAPREHRPLVVLLSGPREAVALGTALALVLATRASSPAAAVCLWGAAAAPASTPGLSAARHLATRIAACLGVTAYPGGVGTDGTPAVASGRVARALLAAEPEHARLQLERMRAEAAEPLVVVLAAPRDEGWDRLLVEADRVVIAIPPNADGSLAALAGEQVCGPTSLLRITLTPAERMLTAGGLWIAPSLRRRLVDTLEGHV